MRQRVQRIAAIRHRGRGRRVVVIVQSVGGRKEHGRDSYVSQHKHSLLVGCHARANVGHADGEATLTGAWRNDDATFADVQDAQLHARRDILHLGGEGGVSPIVGQQFAVFSVIDRR